MYKCKQLFLLVFPVLLLSSCEIDNVDLSGNNAFQPECERRHTAQVQFKNYSRTNRTLTVVWDGLVKVILPPGSESIFFTESSGRHSLIFKVTSTGATGCTQSNPVLADCLDYVYVCDY